MDAELEIAASSINKLEETTGFKILQQQINFYGLCGECSRLDD
jgi:Fe2+ or Zn2+ uptake regulation protein